MNAINTIYRILTSVYFSSADPNIGFFGSKKRQERLDSLANQFLTRSQDFSKETETVKAENPFESAAAKAAMARASQNAEQMQTRILNTLGANASPEAMVAAAGETSKAMGSAAGQIAVGAEANQQTEVERLRNKEMQSMSQYQGSEMAAVENIGSGWRDFFASIDAIGSLASGLAQGAGAIATGGMV